jgi:hypothetical protein
MTGRGAIAGPDSAGTFVLPVLSVHPYGAAAARRGLGTQTVLKEVEPVKTWFVVGSAAAVTAVGVALLAGKGDIRRFLQMRSM